MTYDDLVRVTKAAVIESFEEVVREDGLRMVEKARAPILEAVDRFLLGSLLQQQHIETWTEEQVREAARLFVREALAELRPS